MHRAGLGTQFIRPTINITLTEEETISLMKVISYETCTNIIASVIFENITPTSVEPFRLQASVHARLFFCEFYNHGYLPFYIPNEF